LDERLSPPTLEEMKPFNSTLKPRILLPQSRKKIKKNEKSTMQRKLRPMRGRKKGTGAGLGGDKLVSIIAVNLFVELQIFVLF
jgi:hypothetical protein